MGMGGETYHGPERRVHPRTPTSGRFMLKVGLDHHSAVGFAQVIDISREGIRVTPDLNFETADFLKGKSVIMIGCQSWNRHFSLSGTVASTFHTFPVRGQFIGIRISSTTSDAFLREWVERGIPAPR